MNLRALLVSGAAAFAALASATDYELVIPRDWARVLSAKTVTISDPTGRLKIGDQIVRVRTGVDAPVGAPVRLGTGEAEGLPELSKLGSVEGLRGRIVLRHGSGAGVQATVVPLMGNDVIETASERSSIFSVIWRILGELPWAYILLLAGAIAFVATLVSYFRKEPSQRPAFSFTGRTKDLQDSIRDLKSRLDQVIAAQAELVKKPPVLRSFRRDIESFDQRLRKLSTSAQNQQQALEGITSTLSSLDEKLAAVAERSDSAAAETRKAKDALAQMAATVEKRDKELHTAIDPLSVVPPRVEAVDRRVDELSRAQAAMGKLIESHVKKAESTQADEAKQLSDLRSELNQVRQAVEHIKAIAEATRALQAGIQTMSDSGAKLASELGSLRGELSEMRREVSTSTSESAKRFERLEARSGAIENTVSQAQAALSEKLSGAIEATVSNAQKNMAATLEARSGAIEQSLARAQERMAEAVRAETESLKSAITPKQPTPHEESKKRKGKGGDRDESEGLEVLEGGKHAAPAKGHIPQVFVAADEDEDELVASMPVDPGHPDRWSGLGGSVQRRWGIVMPQMKAPTLKTEGTVKALTPIETPDASAPIGTLIYTGHSVLFGHGDRVRSFWPGQDNRSCNLGAPLPEDPWRMMMFAGYVFCVLERQVNVLHGSTLISHQKFDGDYLAQAHTDMHWAGLMSWGGQLAIDFRDASGSHVGSPRTMDASIAEAGPLAAMDGKVYMATRQGSVFKIELQGSEKLSAPMEGALTVGLAVARNGLFLTQQRDDGAHAIMLPFEGGQAKHLFLGKGHLPHPPVILGDKLYCFLDGELIEGNLKSMQVSARKDIKGVIGVRRMVGLQAGKLHLLGVVACDKEDQASHAIVIDVKSGHQAKLGALNQPYVDMIVAGGHFVVATGCSYQNTLSVFHPYKAEEERKAA